MLNDVNERGHNDELSRSNCDVGGKWICAEQTSNEPKHDWKVACGIESGFLQHLGRKIGGTLLPEFSFLFLKGWVPKIAHCSVLTATSPMVYVRLQ